MTALAAIKSSLDVIFDNRVYRDSVPDSPNGIVLPAASILADVSRTRTLSGDGRTMGMREVWQVDVWQHEADEDDDLVPDVEDALDGLVVGASRLSVKIDGVARLVEEEGIVHHAITLQTTMLM